MKKPFAFVAFTALSAALLVGCSPEASVTPSTPQDITQIKHIIVIYAENRSFDNLYGLYPGANGINNALKTYTPQKDRDGSVLTNLPPTWDNNKVADPTYSTEKLPNAPFKINALPGAWTPDKATRDLVHRFYNNQMQINGGKNDMFAAYSDAGGLSMGYYDGAAMQMWNIAKQYTLADNFFMGTFGGSYQNHIYLACACASVNPAHPASNTAKVEADGKTLTLDTAKSPTSAMQGPPTYVADKAYSPDGYGINTLQAPYQPSGNPPVAGGDLKLADPAKDSTLPPQTQTTIGDLLSAKGISWAWYGGGWNAALKDGMQDPATKRSVIYTGDINFQPHHQPYNYFANYAPGTQARVDHIKDTDDFEAALKAGNLPAVSFIKPQGSLNQHPGYTDVMKGDAYVAGLINKVQSNPVFKDTAIIVTYDENGGFWDHATPPAGDRWGPGTRIPTIIVSPYAKKGTVDHTSYDTSSILKFITKRFGLDILDGLKTRPNAGDLTGAFDFTQKP